MTIPRTRELIAFLGVGGAGFVTDVAAFNVLRSLGPMVDHPLVARTLAVALAMVLTYTGNRAITWHGRTTGDRRREVRLFVLFNLIGFAFSAACLAFSRHVLGLNSAWADNISANIIGVGLGTEFRFVTYRRCVFPSTPLAPEPATSTRRPPGCGPTRARRGKQRWCGARLPQLGSSAVTRRGVCAPRTPLPSPVSEISRNRSAPTTPRPPPRAPRDAQLPIRDRPRCRWVLWSSRART